MNLLKMGTGFGALGAVTTGPRRPIRTGHFGLDASHQAMEKDTHPTHWPAADFQCSPRMRSGCAVMAHCMCRAVRSLPANTRRVRVGDGR